MRNFNWETLPKHSVEGKHNIWTADKTDGEYELDTEHMEELFSRKQDQQQVKALNRQSLRGLPNSASGGVMVSSLNTENRGYILMNQLPPRVNPKSLKL